VPLPPRGLQADIREDFLLLGEGSGDAALVHYLCETRNITGYQIEDVGGNSKFKDYIGGVASRPGFHRLRGIIIVADCDNGAVSAFDSIRKQIKKASLPYPENPFEWGRRPNLGTLATYVLLIPFNGNQALSGALETLLLPSAMQHLSQYVSCLEIWATCANISSLDASHRDKSRLRALLTAAHPEDPNLGLQYALSPTKNLIPLDHSCFDPLADLLRSLPSTL